MSYVDHGLPPGCRSFEFTDRRTKPGQGASDQAESVDLEATRIPDNLSIDLDGRLDEEAWSLATPISDFTQQYHVEGGVPSERTEIRVVFNGDELFIGAILYDDPSGILAYQKCRDAGLGTDDRFMWILDTFLDGRTGYFFEINAAGLMGDGLITGSGGGGRGGGGGCKSPGTGSGRRARARWIVKPGNDLFLVYTNNWRNLGGSVFDRNLETLSRGGSVKVNYTYRL